MKRAPHWMSVLPLPAQAVEAAAKRLYVLENQGRSARPFDSLPQAELDARIEMAQHALEAAAPHILAAAFNEAADAWAGAVSWSDSRSSPEYVQRWLRSRANTYRPAVE